MIRILAITLWFVVVFASAGALSPRAADAPCTFNASLGALDAAQQNTTGINYLQVVREELRMRKSLLGNILDCSVQEAENLKGTLSGMQRSEGGIETTRTNLARALDSAMSYYASEKSTIGNLGIRGTQDAARAVRAWRATHYEPTAQGVVALLLWTKNQNLFQVAENRLAQIENTIKKLKLGDNDEVTSLVAKASDNLAEAKKLNQDARNALLHIDEGTEPLTVVKNSLDALSKTYQAFFDVSEAVKKFFPH